MKAKCSETTCYKCQSVEIDYLLQKIGTYQTMDDLCMEPPTTPSKLEYQKIMTRVRLVASIRPPIVWVLIVGIVVAVLIVFMPFFDHHEGTAAWVQAAGSLLIIAATAGISQRELVRAKAREEQARDEIRKSCAVLARYCLEALDVVIQRLSSSTSSNHRDNFTKAYVPSDFEIVIEGLAAIPLHSLGQTSLTTALLELRTAMGQIKHRLDLVLKHPIASISPRDLNPTLRGRLFNKAAAVIRSVEGNAAEQDLSRLDSFVEHPRRVAE